MKTSSNIRENDSSKNSLLPPGAVFIGSESEDKLAPLPSTTIAFTNPLIENKTLVKSVAKRESGPNLEFILSKIDKRINETVERDRKSRGSSEIKADVVKLPRDSSVFFEKGILDNLY